MGAVRFAPENFDQPRRARTEPAPTAAIKGIMRRQCRAAGAAEFGAVRFAPAPRRRRQLGRPHVIGRRVDQIAGQNMSLSAMRETSSPSTPAGSTSLRLRLFGFSCSGQSHSRPAARPAPLARRRKNPAPRPAGRRRPAIFRQTPPEPRHLRSCPDPAPAAAIPPRPGKQAQVRLPRRRSRTPSEKQHCWLPGLGVLRRTACKGMAFLALFARLACMIGSSRSGRDVMN